MTILTPAPAGVSVVIAVYQAERFVAEALDAVLSQTRTPAELILVDDGSTDGSRAVIDDFLATHYRASPTIHVIAQANSGPSAARNTGFDASTQPLVAFHDADDRALPTWLEVLAGVLDAQPDVACALGTQVVELEAGSSIPAWLADERVGDPLSGLPSRRYAQMCPVMRRTAIEIAGPYDESMRLGEDTDLLLRFIDAGLRVEYLDDVVLRRRVHAASLTQDAEAFRRAQFGVLARRIRRKQAQR